MSIPSISARLLWPFARAMGDYQAELKLLSSLGGLHGEGIADPDARIALPMLERLLVLSLERSGQPTLGLLAGARLEPGDFGVAEAAARAAPNFGSALRVFGRYLKLADETTQVEVETRDDVVHWRMLQPGGPRLAASNDFKVRAAIALGHQWLGLRVPPLAVHLEHARPAYAERYATHLGCPVYFRQDANAVLFDRRAEDLPLPGSHPDLFEVLTAQAARKLADRASHVGVACRVERTILAILPDEPANMTVVASRLGMSVATLRRRLADEGTTHKRLLEGVRRREAMRHLREPSLNISQIAFSLGFATPQAFCRAFRRWTAQSPAEYRRAHADILAPSERAKDRAGFLTAPQSEPIAGADPPSTNAGLE